MAENRPGGSGGRARGGRGREVTERGRGGGGGGGDGFDLRDLEAALDDVVRPKRETCYKLVMFDLETTGLGRSAHIIQIAACCGQDTFDIHVQPKCPIDKRASEITGYSLSQTGALLKGNQPVAAVSIREGMDRFLQFLERIKGPEGGPGLLLTAHNCRQFDSKILITAMMNTGKDAELVGLIIGFTDTLPVYRRLYPHFERHRLGYLVEKLLPGTRFDAHDAAEDVRVLDRLVQKLEKDHPGALIMESFTANYIKETFEHAPVIALRKRTLKPLVAGGYISDYMAKKASDAGIDLAMLERVHEEQGAEGVKELLSAKGPDGKPRVTKRKAILNKFCEYLNLREE